MDLMYGDLLHLDYMDAFQELRDNNMLLKEMLDGHADALENLQKGYDVLYMEFRALQCNYNSLLSGARAKMQRNDEMIAQLIAEKEAIMINAAKHMRRRVDKKT